MVLHLPAWATYEHLWIEPLAKQAEPAPMPGATFSFFKVLPASPILQTFSIFSCSGVSVFALPALHASLLPDSVNPAGT
jgi:hypothetical protein